MSRARRASALVAVHLPPDQRLAGPLTLRWQVTRESAIMGWRGLAQEQTASRPKPVFCTMIGAVRGSFDAVGGEVAGGRDE